MFVLLIFRVYAGNEKNYLHVNYTQTFEYVFFVTMFSNSVITVTRKPLDQSILDLADFI